MREIDHIPILKDNIQPLVEICKRHHVSKLFVFGSASSGTFNEKRSDIDLMVELLPMLPEEKGEHLLELWDELEALLKRKVDLLTDQPIKNPFLREDIEQSKRLIYDEEREEVLV